MRLDFYPTFSPCSSVSTMASNNSPLEAKPMSTSPHYMHRQNRHQYSRMRTRMKVTRSTQCRQPALCGGRCLALLRAQRPPAHDINVIKVEGGVARRCGKYSTGTPLKYSVFTQGHESDNLSKLHVVRGLSRLLGGKPQMVVKPQMMIMIQVEHMALHYTNQKRDDVRRSLSIVEHFGLQARDHLRMSRVRATSNHASLSISKGICGIGSGNEWTGIFDPRLKTWCNKDLK